MPLTEMFRRPKSCKDMEVRESRLLPPKGYDAITFFGLVLMRKPQYEEWSRNATSKQYRQLCSHEMIHQRQAVSLHNSWLCYYVRYAYYYLRNRPLRYGHMFAYLANPFEMEAYLFEADTSYASKSQDGTDNWRKLASYPPACWHALMSAKGLTTKAEQADFFARVAAFMKNKW